MSVTVKLYQMLEVDVGGEIKSLGSLTAPLEYTAATEEVFEVRTVVADNYVRQVLWQDGDGGVDDFDVAIIETDADILIELAADRAGTPKYQIIELKVDATIGSGRLFLVSDDTNTTANTVLASGSATTVDQIDQIAVKNNVADDAGDANVRLILLT